MRKLSNIDAQLHFLHVEILCTQK